MILKIIFIVLLLLVIYSLGSGLYFLLKDRGQTTRVVRSLSWRIGLSFLIFILLMVAYYMGLIQPHVV